jgi:hypothetical protein
METEVSLPCSQEPATSDPTDSSPRPRPQSFLRSVLILFSNLLLGFSSGLFLLKRLSHLILVLLRSGKHYENPHYEIFSTVKSLHYIQIHLRCSNIDSSGRISYH